MEEILNNFGTLSLIDKESESMNNHNLITEFILSIKNDKQYDILLKLFTGYFGNMYLIDKKNILDTDIDTVIIQLLGARNIKCRETYTIEFSNGCFTCDCKDYTFRCKRLGIVCKHISFLVCKVAKILDFKFFNTLKLSDENIIIFKNALNSNSTWENRDLSVKNINCEFNINNKKFNIEETCPICYEYFSDKSKCISCPECNNYVHKDCMNIWLETKDSCVYCRNSIWSNYIEDVSKI